jgi:hypothetical protein
VGVTDKRTVAGKETSYSQSLFRVVQSGKLYISVKSATFKEAKASQDRQPRFVYGLANLNAKMMNAAALRTTGATGHRQTFRN